MNDSRLERDYRSILRDQLATRCRVNPRYSLRAFARDLSISPSKLSEIFSTKQGLSTTKASQIAIRLGLSPHESSLFCDSVECLHGKTPTRRKLARERIAARGDDEKYRLVAEESFAAISDWYHLAILQLTLTKGFKSDAAWIARRLGIKKLEAETAIARLFRLGMLKEENGQFRPATTFTRTTDDVPSSAIREFHRQIIQKALEALAFQTVEERDSSAMVLPLAKKDFVKAKELIKGFRRDFTEKLNEAQGRDAVYCLSIQFFNLSPGGNAP